MKRGHEPLFYWLMKNLKIPILIVVFGLPVIWYLFLQAFGENQFELPSFESIDLICGQGFDIGDPTLLLDTTNQSMHRNEWARLQSALGQRSQVAVLHSVECAKTIGSSVVLIGSDRVIRGKYGISRSEVDRLITEIDIYLTNNGEDNSSK